MIIARHDLEWLKNIFSIYKLNKVQWSPKVLGHFSNFLFWTNLPTPPPPPKQCWFMDEVHAILD